MAKTQQRIRQLNITFKDACRVVTQGSNITLAGGAPDTLDGVSLAVNDRILVKDQSTASENGIYEVTTLGTGADGTWGRVVDMDEGLDVRFGTQTLIIEGTNDTKRIYCQTDPDPITVGTTSMVWQRSTDTGVTLGDHIFGEVPTGAIDGSNTTFDTANAFQTGTLQVFLNGQRLRAGATEDYTITDSDTFEMADAPKGAPGNPDVLLVDYIK